jgi:hypothetical protein
MNIELHIEELILHGFLHTDRHRIAQAIQSELVRLLAGKDLPPAFDRNLEFSRLDGGSFVVRTGEKPESTGTRIGQAVYRGIAGNQRAEAEFSR